MAFDSSYSLHLILLLVLLLSVVAQTYQNITLSSSLTAALDKNDSWKSPSGDFAFGFQQVEAGMFLLAIWFDKIPEKTIIWSANGGNLVLLGSIIQLTTYGLSDEKGMQVWAPVDVTGPVSSRLCLTQEILCWQARTQPTCGRVSIIQLTHWCPHKY
ncbi:hypothetical protein SLE2022_006800 [Rubroshorea leprosula]